jgi:DNA invertase Pin-like site-specific DNA recombinase
MNITPTPQVRAGCYCRISSDPDDKREGVDRQKQDTTAVCDIQKWTPAGFYIDNDRSASNGKQRPEWDRLLTDITAGKIDAIAAWDQDRGWRMMHELEDLRKFFTKLGRKIPLATTGQGAIDLYSPTGVLTAQIKTAVSEHEIAMMKVRMRRAAKQKAERGLPQWKHAFGYLVGEHTPDCPPKCKSYHHQKDPKTAPLVEAAYKAILAGTKLKDIAAIFNDAGADGLNGKPWSETTVSLFLRAHRNAGLRSHNDEPVYGEDGQPVRGTWPPLVEESTWKAAQAKLTAPGRRPGPKTVKRHLLTGLLKCGNTELPEKTKERLGRDWCGGHLGGNWQMQHHRGGPKAHTITYRCLTCRGVAVRAEHIEPLIYGYIIDRLMRPDAVDLLKTDIHDEAEAEAIRTELTTLYGEIEKIAIERGQRLIDGQQAKIATDIVKADIAKLEHRQQDAERMRVFEGLPLGTPEVAEAIKELPPDRFRAILDLLLTVVIKPVGKGGHVFNPERVDETWKC